MIVPDQYTSFLIFILGLNDTPLNEYAMITSTTYGCEGWTLNKFTQTMI